MTLPPDTAIPLCASTDLQERGRGVSFDVVFSGQNSRGFAIRYNGVAYGYLNRCAHIPMEMDHEADRFLDDSGEWLLCSTHGAVYEPHTGLCVGGPCRGGRLVPIALSESDGMVRWHTGPQLKPIEF